MKHRTKAHTLLLKLMKMALCEYEWKMSTTQTTSGGEGEKGQIAILELRFRSLGLPPRAVSIGLSGAGGVRPGSRDLEQELQTRCTLRCGGSGAN